MDEKLLHCSQIPNPNFLSPLPSPPHLRIGIIQFEYKVRQEPIPAPIPGVEREGGRAEPPQQRIHLIGLIHVEGRVIHEPLTDNHVALHSSTGL